MPGLAGDFSQDSQLNEALDDLIRRGERGLADCLDVFDADHGFFVELFQQPVTVARSPSKTIGNLSPMLLAQCQDLTRGRRGFEADFGYAAQEEGEPALPITGVSNRLKPVVVFLPMLFEKVRQVEHRFVKNLALAQKERD